MISIRNSVLVVIDVQGKLAQLMHSPDYLPALKAVIKAAQLLEIPTVLTEQAPGKIGSTIPEVRELLKDQPPIVKQTFSCWGEEQFVNTITSLCRNEIIIVGIESHVCVYQTVRDLLRRNYHVHLVTDAVSSRAVHNAKMGIERCEKEGAVLTTTEMIITELIESTRHSKFREIMALLKESK
ncbi:MAG: hydrolase [Candidatus Omnitrophica bacterium]|nr:hydrolase [Candidatus Omnitrophota bacterium]